MRELQDVAASLLDVDGFCRDLNFERPTWAGVGDLIGYLDNSFQDVSATDLNGDVLAEVNPESVLSAARESGSAHVILDGGSSLVKHLQIFVVREADGSPFVELTFFPDDLKATQDIRTDFLNWADNLRACLKARRYYARYENASWRFGDVSEDSGVFLVSDLVVPDASIE